MNKKIVGIMVAVILVCAVGIGGLLLRTKDMGENNNTNNSGNKSNDKLLSESNVLVVYFSATNNTKDVAEKLAKKLDGDIFEIVPDKQYTSSDLDWTDNKSRVSKEHADESLRDVKLKNTKVDNWDSYDIVLIGYPIWWGIAAWPVNTFVSENDFTGKTVIPFCTSASSGLGESDKLLAADANGGIWLDGHRFSSSASDSDIESFINSNFK